MNDSDKLWLDLCSCDLKAFTKIILDMDINWDKLVMATEMLDLIEYTKFIRNLTVKVCHGEKDNNA